MNEFKCKVDDTRVGAGDRLKKKRAEAYQRSLESTFGWLIEFKPYLKTKLRRRMFMPGYKWGWRNSCLRVFAFGCSPFEPTLKIMKTGKVQIRKEKDRRLANFVCELIEDYIVRNKIKELT